MKVRFPSLEISYLPNSIRKGLITPTIEFVEDIPYGGVYWRKKDIIQISTISNNNLESIIAHEYRHHWQMYNTTLDKFKAQPFNLNIEYKQAIIEFFKDPFELDALIFELNFAHKYNYKWEWYEWVLKS